MFARPLLVLLAATGLAACAGGGQDETRPDVTAVEAVAPGPSAPFAPRLVVDQTRYQTGAPTSVSLLVRQRPNERPIGKISFVVPFEYGLDVPESGTIGRVSAVLGGAPGVPHLHLSGALEAASVDADAAKGCAPGAVAAFRASLESGSTSDSAVPVTVYHHGISGENAFTLCVPPPARLPRGLAVRTLELRLDRGLTSPGPGQIVWSGLFTPLGAGGPEAKATTESRGLIIAPASIALEPAPSPRLTRGERLQLVGYSPEAGAAAGRLAVMFRGAERDALKPVGRVRVDRGGGFVFTQRMAAAGTRYYRALFPARPGGRALCANPRREAPAGCRSATLTASRSDVVEVKVQ